MSRLRKPMRLCGQELHRFSPVADSGITSSAVSFGRLVFTDTDPAYPLCTLSRPDTAGRKSLFRSVSTVDQAYSCVKTREGIDATSMPLAPVWSLIGIADAWLGLRKQALDGFRKASSLSPHQEEHWLNLTRELMEQGLYADAVSGAQDGLRSLPNSYALHLRLGAAYLAAGHYPEAEATFRELVIAGDPLPTGYVGLAQVLLRTGRAEEAVTELNAAQRKLGANFLICYFRGLALDRAAKPKDALSAFQEAAQMNPNSAEAHLGLGKTELRLDEMNHAVV